jgi:hypothetical protein
MHAVSCKTGWAGTTPAANHPGWPGADGACIGVWACALYPVDVEEAGPTPFLVTVM